jgi:outer membrane cobalamin receptor
LKSILHIETVLILLVLTTAYPQRRTEKRIVRTPVDTSTVKGLLQEGKRTPVPDSLKMKSDSTGSAPTDSLVIDSIRVRFLPGMGQMSMRVDTLSALHQKNILWSDAKVVGDLMWTLPGFFFRELGEAGKWEQLHAFGMDGRTIGVLLDGRPMNDPITGTYNFSDMPLEFIDHIETLSGTASTMASSDAAGTAMNFVSRSYNSYRPLTKLRFVQDPKGTIFTDGLFTQNVARGLNLTIGFQRHASDGRYTNAALNAWNVRTRLRYNISERLNIALTDFYTKSANGLNGGVANLLDEIGTHGFNKDAWDKRLRRDVTLNALARIFSDSSSTTQATAYYSTLEREYYNRSGGFIDDFTRSSFWGARFQQLLRFDSILCNFGGTWETRKSDSTRVLASHRESERTLFMQTEFGFVKLFVPSVFVRSTWFDGEHSFSTGAGIKSSPTDWLMVFGDVSWFDRFPTFQERYWTDSLFSRVNSIQKEQHAFYQVGLNIQAGANIQVSLTGFQRTVQHAIVFQPALSPGGFPAISISNSKEVLIQGMNGSAGIHWSKFELFGVMTLLRYKEASVIKTLMPDIILAGEASYRDTFFKEKLDAKFGVRSCFSNRQQGMQFDPPTLSYVENKASILGRSTTLDLFMILKIGDAHVSLSWKNIFNTLYILSPIYPMPGRHIRLGVNWVFMD